MPTRPLPLLRAALRARPTCARLRSMTRHRTHPRRPARGGVSSAPDENQHDPDHRPCCADPVRTPGLHGCHESHPRTSSTSVRRFGIGHWLVSARKLIRNGPPPEVVERRYWRARDYVRDAARLKALGYSVMTESITGPTHHHHLPGRGGGRTVRTPCAPLLHHLWTRPRRQMSSGLAPEISVLRRSVRWPAACR